MDDFEEQCVMALVGRGIPENEALGQLDQLIIDTHARQMGLEENK